MPKKRATRMQGAKSKPKVQLDRVGEDLSEEEKGKKLDVYLQDLKIRVSEQNRKLAKDLENMLSLIDKKFLWDLSRLPIAVRKMTLEEFISCGGTVDLAEKHLDIQEDNMSSLTLSAMKIGKLSHLQPHIFETISEEEGATPSCTFTQPRTAARRGRPAMNTPMSHMMKTPAMGRSMSATGWETPLVTPKFDPRLPMTGNMKRAAKPGEIIMSMGGSPIQNPTRLGGKGNIRKRGKTLTVDVDPECELENLVIPDNIPKAQLSQLVGVLQDFIKKAKN
ncbi:borealin-like [Mizuhopecten yessoensis]|uniref:Borealin n=1 Tax=Mizuhopecten yessoensis TaxID=6573 RepID=A0A210PT53_MIZYE|nr:borealin-like [Mizuhopecten yessoensis]OWF39636.1 Borealin [Mizuhopecten yessoensis]